MNCRQVRDLLPLYVDRALASEVHAAVARHLVDCAECRKRSDLDRALGAALAALPPTAEAMMMGPRLRRRVLSALEGDPHRHAHPSPILAIANALATFSGILVIGFLLTMLSLMSRASVEQIATAEPHGATPAGATTTASQPREWGIPDRSKTPTPTEHPRLAVIDDQSSTPLTAGAPRTMALSAGATGTKTDTTSDPTVVAKVATVEQFYQLVEQKRLDEAYRYLSPAFQAMEPFVTWAAGYSATQRVFVTAVPLADGSVAINLLALDRDTGGGSRIRQFKGRWFLTYSEAMQHWLLDRADIAEIDSTVPAQPVPPMLPTPPFSATDKAP